MNSRVFIGFLAGLCVLLTLRAPAAREAEAEAGDLLGREASLRQRQAELLLQIQELEQAKGALVSQSEAAAAIDREVSDVSARSGLADMRGPGVEIVLDDTSREGLDPQANPNLYIVHDVDVLRVINILRSAGAECISINGERLLSTSRIRCGGPTIRVKDRPLAPPFVIRAIGDPYALYDALAGPAEDGGMSELEMLSAFGIQASAVRREEILVPRFLGTITFAYAEIWE